MAAVGLAHNPLEFIPIYHGLSTLMVVLDIFAQLITVPTQMSPRLGDGQLSKVLKTTLGSIMQGDSVERCRRRSSMPIACVLARCVGKLFLSAQMVFAHPVAHSIES